MRRLFLFLIAFPAALASMAASDATGRWSGRAQVPGVDLPLVVDLARDASGGWIGSLIVPGYDVKGAPLGNVRITDDKVAFDAGDALGAAPNGASFEARLDGRGGMAGRMRQAGNVAPFTLKRVGEPQVEFARRSTRVARETEGHWVGQYELAGYSRNVTVDIANREGATPSVDFVVVGKATTKLPIDLVAEEEGLLHIESRAYRITFEGRIQKGEGRIVGTMEQGPFEAPLVLRREGAKPS